MDGSLSSEKRLVDGQKAANRGRTVSGSWSTSSEDGEVGHSTGISFITELAPGGRRLIAGSSRVEPGMVN